MEPIILRLVNIIFVGLVEARVMCFYRRSEIPSSLLPVADKVILVCLSLVKTPNTCLLILIILVS